MFYSWLLEGLKDVQSESRSALYCPSDGTDRCICYLTEAICEHTCMHTRIPDRLEGVTLLLPALTAPALIILGCRRLGRRLRGSRHARSRKSRGRELQGAQQSSLHLRSGTHAVRLCREDMLPQRDVVGETAVLQA